MARILYEDDYGFLAMDGNELTVGSKVDDPPKLRLTSTITATGGGGGVVSFNRSRQAGVVCDGHSQEEMAMLRVEQAEDVRGQEGNLKAEFNFLANTGASGDDSAMQKPLAFIWNCITRTRLALFGETRTDTMWAPDGLTFTQQQADGNFASYRVDQPFDKQANPVALWSAWTGKL